MSYTAIFGGTFNPFHIGHFEILQALQNDDNVDEIFLMPAKMPPHKACTFLADDETRIEMCRIAAQNFNKVKVCLVEFQREGKSYTYDTINVLKELYPEKKFAFVCGGDMLVYFDKWYKYEELMKLMDFIAFRRTDTDDKLFDDYVEKFRKMSMNISVNETRITSVCSTEIREDFLKAKELLPESIFEYLNSKGVYNE
jgi:nicotinate-nucleotide adenylyltransferase